MEDYARAIRHMMVYSAREQSCPRSPRPSSPATHVLFTPATPPPTRSRRNQSPPASRRHEDSEPRELVAKRVRQEDVTGVAAEIADIDAVLLQDRKELASLLLKRELRVSK